MKQKDNSNIFLLNTKKNEWCSKYFEKNIEESSLLNYQNINLQNYLKQFLFSNCLMLKNYKCQISNRNFYLFVSFCNAKPMVFLTNETIIAQSVRFKIKKTRKFNSNSSKISELKIKRLNLLNKYKKYLQNTKYFNKDKQQKNTFLEKLFENISLFTNKKLNIFITFQNLNKSLSVQVSKKEQIFLKKNLLFLKLYSKNKFFKESFNIIFLITKTKNSTKVLANFISKQFEYFKRHNYFLIFLKQILICFCSSKLSKFKGIKIVVKGKFSESPRAKTRLILIGKMPIQTISKKIYYSKTTSFTKNGTIGVKVWINLD